MFIPILIVWFTPLINAAAIVSRSQSYPLSQRSVLGPTASITVGNNIIAPDGYSRSATLVDGTFPGPLITAQKGDSFSIQVIDNLTDPTMYNVTTVHWHGIFQNGTNYADGTASVTQCPIVPNNSFTYTFNAQQQAGTFWYHSHYSVQYCDGLRGGLIIYDPNDPFAQMYDVDDESTVVTLADWYHQPAPQLAKSPSPHLATTLINGLGRQPPGLGIPSSPLAVINVQPGKRYRLRLIGMSCDPNFLFSINNHNFTVIEADGELTEPLVVDQLQIFAGQRYSVILVANQPVDNYWIRAAPSFPPPLPPPPPPLPNPNFVGGINSAILRYQGAPLADPTGADPSIQSPLVETSLHAYINPGAPGVPGYGNADINIMLNVTADTFPEKFYINGISFVPPTVPALLQILNGSYSASQLLPNGSYYVLEPNKVVEVTLTMPTGLGAEHPIHLHGHSFDVVQSAKNSTFNYVNPVRRDTVNAGTNGQQSVIRFVTDNSGPWIFHCHIDWHLEDGFAVVMAEDPPDTKAHISPTPPQWDQLCPIFNSS